MSLRRSSGSTRLFGAHVRRRAEHRARLCRGRRRGRRLAIADKSYVETQPRLSPDGRWVAYAMNETGILEVYVAPFPGPGGRQRLSTHGGQWPRWSREGDEIVFVAADNTLMSAPIASAGSGLRIGESRPLFHPAFRPSVRLDAYPYDVSRDGRRLLVNTIVDQAPPPPLALVVNWTSALKR